MNYEIIKKESFYVIGIAVRTINDGVQSQKDIAELYSKFFGENLIEKIPNKENNDIYCIYTDYESDFKGAYNTILGCRVSSLDSIPEGFEGKEIPETIYKHYIASGKLPDCVGIAWNGIWQSGIERKYIADFDLYSEKAMNPENAEVDIYVS